MRIVDIQLNGPDSPGLELHPGITVVSGLSPDDRRAIAGAIAAVCRGHAPATGLVVEAHDLLFPADEQSLAALEITRDVDVVVTAAELGLTTTSVNGDRGEASADASPADPVEVAADAVMTRQQAHEQAQRDLDAHAAAAVSARVEHQAAETRHAEARSARDQAERDLAEARGAIDGFHATVAEQRASRREAAAATLADAERAVAVAEASLADLPEADLAALDAAVDEARAAVDEARAELAEATTALAETDETLVAEELGHEIATAASEVDRCRVHVGLAEDRLAAAEGVLEELEGSDDSDGAADVAAVDAVRASVERLDAELAVVVEPAAREDEHEIPETAEVLAAREAVAEIRVRLAELEGRVQPVRLEPEEVAAIDEAHRLVEEAEAKAEGPFAGPRARRRLREASEAEAQLLSQHGFSSYGSYLLDSSSMHADPAAQRAAAEARLALADAEATLSSAEQAAARQALSAELAALEAADQQRASQIAHAVIEVLGALDAAEADIGIAVAAVERAAGDGSAEVSAEARAVLERAISWAAAADEARARRAAGDDDRSARAAAVDDARADLAEAHRTLESATATHAALVERHQAALEQQAAREDERARRAAALEQARGSLEAAEERYEATQSARSEGERTLDRRAAASTALAVAQERRTAAEQHRAEVDADDEPPADAAQAAERVTRAEAALAAAETELTAADTAVGHTTRRLEVAVAAEAAARSTLMTAADALDEARAELVGVEHRRATALEAPPATAPAPASSVRADLGVYLLSRLAAQRSVGRAGALPLVIDGALEGAGEVGPVLDLFTRMARSVQIIIFSDDPSLAAWADGLGLETALAVST